MKNKTIDVNDKTYEFLTILLFIAITLIMLVFSRLHVLGIDELDWTLRLIDVDNIRDIFNNLLLYGYNLPLYYLILWPFFLINHTNQFWLTLPSFVFTIIGLIYIYKISKKICNKKIALLTLMIACSSLFLLPQIAWSIRPYALLFALSTMSFYYYIKKNEDEKWYNYLIYYIVITLLLFTHWFSAFIVFAYGIRDLVLVIKRKIKFKYFVFYVIPLLLILIWIFYVLRQHISSFDDYWPTPPKLIRIYNLILYMVNYNWISLIVLGLAIIFKSIKKEVKLKFSSNDKLILYFLGCSLFIVLGIFIYSCYINPKSSLWVGRYFIVIVPHIVIALGYYINKLINSASKLYSKTIGFILKVVPFLLAFLTICYNIAHSIKDPYAGSNAINYEEICNYLLQQEDVYDDKTIIIFAVGTYFIDYYIKYHNITPPCNLISGEEFEQKEKTCINDLKYRIKEGVYTYDSFNEYELAKYNKIYFVAGRGIIEKSEIMKLEQNFNIVRYDLKTTLCEYIRKGDV